MTIKLGKWITKTPERHRCIKPLAGGAAGDIWECDCGKRWVYWGCYAEGYDDSYWSTPEAWEAEQERKKVVAMRRAEAGWFRRLFIW